MILHDFDIFQMKALKLSVQVLFSLEIWLFPLTFIWYLINAQI